MAWKIQVTQAKPNPAGKDTNRHAPIAQQLLAEWVDLKNIGDASVTLSTLHLTNVEFGPGCQLKKQAVVYWNGPSSITLRPGEVVRVHTGREYESWQMRQEDRNGVDHHAYANRGGFVLNNDCGDVIGVYWQSNGQWHCEDAASYDANPPEGQILVRSGSKLLPVPIGARYW
ncbi:MAG TPA: hypothetical protein VK181_12575 [Rhizobium sp.]|nr:hypothetical protein [Rhizobium sp.]